MVMQFLANVFGVLGNVMRAAMDTHIAEILFAIAGGAVKLLGVITSLPTPLLAVAMGLHGLWLWGKLGWATLGSLATRAAGLGVSLVGLAVKFGFVGDAGIVMAAKLGASEEQIAAMNTAAKAETGVLAGLANVGKSLLVPALLAAGAAAVYFAYKSFTGQTATDKWVTSMQAVVNKAPMFDGLNVAYGAVAKTQNELAATAARLAPVMDAFGRAEKAAGGGTLELNAAAWQQLLRVAALAGAWRKFTGEAEMATGRLSYLAARYGGLTQAIGLATLAGVKFSAALGSQAGWVNALQKISALVEGYRMMGQSGSAVANDANAVTFSIEMQDSKVQQLNQAWQAFISTIQGGQTGFVGFEQQMLGMGQAATGAGAALRVSGGAARISSGAVAGAAASAASARVSFSGLNTASLNLRSTFQQTITSASTLLQSITTMGSAMANGASGERLIASASRDVVAQMIPLGTHSAYARAEIYALAQEAGYTGVNSLKAMSQWAGTTAGSASRLNRAMSQLTIQSSSLNKDVNALGSALGINLNSQMTHAMQVATGFSGKLNTAISALLNSKTATGVAQKALHAYWQEQLQVTGSVHGANTALQLLAERIMAGKVAAAGAHPDMSRLATELEQVGRKANLSQGQIVSMISQVTHMSREAVTAALSQSNLARRFGNVSVAAQDAAGRLAGVGYTAAAASAKADAAVTSHLSPLAAKLRQIGQQGATALGTGITAGTPHASAAAASMANQAHTKVASMAGQFRSAGANASAGLAAGITAGAGAAIGAAQSLVDRVNSTLSGVKGLNVHSPSKLWHQYGFWAVQGLVNGLLAGGPKLMAAVRNMVNSINRAFKAGALTGAQDSSLVSWVKADNSKLQALAARRKAIAAQIAAVNATDKALQSSFGSIIGLGHAPAAYSGKVPTAQQMVTNLQTELADIKRFAADLKKLKALGLDNSIIQRIIAMGPMQGAAYAEVLIKAAEAGHGIGTGKGKMGGPGTGPPLAGDTGIIAQLNSAYQQIQSYSKQAASSVTASMYAAGVASAKGLVAGLKAQEKAIDKQMRHIADVLVRAIRKALRIHSPSGVMHDHGLMITQGLAGGIDAGAPLVEAAMRRVAGIVSGTRLFIPPPWVLHPASGGSSNPGGPMGGGGGRPPWIPPVANPGGPLIPWVNPGGRVGGPGTGPPVVLPGHGGTGGRVPLTGPPVNPGGPMGGVTIHVEVHGHVLTEHQLGDVVRDIVQRHIHANGRSDLTPGYGRG